MTIENIARALATLTRSGYSPNNITLDPNIVADLFSKEVILKDGNKVMMSMEEYHEYVLNFNPPDKDNLEEFNNKKMVLEL